MIQTISLRDGVLLVTKKQALLFIVEFHVCQGYKSSSRQALRHVVIM